MVQIMNSGQSSRNRAERASLDFPPGMPLSDNVSKVTSDSPSTLKKNKGNEEIDEAFMPEDKRVRPSAICANSEDEEDDPERGAYNSMPILHPEEESNNNLTESTKDWGLVTDPWTASSALTLPDDIRESLLKKGSKAHRHKGPNRHDRRRLSKSSNGSGNSTNREGRPKSSSSSKEMEINKNVDPSNSDSDSGQKGFKPVLYCYRCFKKFPTYATWRKHAVYDHILTKNPYPIVEMNYIDPSTLELGLCTEIQGQTDRVDSLVEDKQNENLDSECAADSPKEHLKIKFCKEKGTYVVKQFSVSEESSVPSKDTDSVFESELVSDNVEVVPPQDPSSVLRLTLERSLEKSSDPPVAAPIVESVETEPVKDSDGVLKLSNAAVNPINRSILQGRLQGNSLGNSSSSSVHSPKISEGNGALEIRKTSGQFQRAMSIESELAGLNDDEFEKALEQATERSRTFATDDQNDFVFGSVDGQPGDNSLGKTTRNAKAKETDISTNVRGETKADTEADHIPKTTTETMISQELPSSIPQSQEVEKSVSNDVLIVTDKVGPKSRKDISLDVFLEKEKVTEAPAAPPNELKEPRKHVEPKKPPIESKEKQRQRMSVDGSPDSNDSYTLKIIDHGTDEKDKSTVEQSAKEIDIVDSVETDKTINEVSNSEGDEHATAEEETAPVDSDDFQCRVCQKIFLSDDEVNEHFSQEHFRLAVGQGILEPESPFPDSGENIGFRSIFTEDEPDHNVQVEEAVLHNRRISADQHQSTPFAEALAVLHYRNNHAVNNNGEISGEALGLSQSQPNFNRPPGPRGPPLHIQHSNPRHLNPNIRMGPVPVHNPIGLQGLANNMRPQLSSSVNFINNQSGPRYSIANRPQHHMIGQGPRPQGGNVPPHLSHRQINYPTSLHNALTSSNVQTTQSQIRSGGPPNHLVPQGGFVPQRPPLRPIQQSQQNQSHMNQSNGPRVVGVTSLHGGQSSQNGPYGQLAQTIAQQQHMINEINSHRERDAFQQQQLQRQRQLQQQIQQQQRQQHSVPQMPRLQQYPQQQQTQPNQSDLQFRSMQDPSRSMQVNRTQLPMGGPPTMQGKRSATIETVEVHPRKQPRVDSQFHLNNQMRNLPPAEITISQRILPNNSNNNSNNSNISNTNNHRNPPTLTLDRTVVAALGSVGTSGGNSVRLGNAITLSVCPNTSESSSTFSSNIERLQSSAGSSQSNTSSNPSSRNISSPVVNVNPNQVSSVLAVRGVTVTAASPPITSISPVSTASNPSPSGSPSLNNSQQQSVIQRCSASNSPVSNFSPPVINSSRNGTSTGPGSTNSLHNFAIPRLPPHRGQSNVNVHSPSYNLNSEADRPDRPPTVDLTEDDIQAYNNQRRMAGLSAASNIRQAQPQPQHGTEQQRRVVGPGNQMTGSNPYALREPRHVGCTICGVLFNSIQALEAHKLSSHGQMHNYSGGPRGPQTAVRSSGIQIREVRSMNPQHLGMGHAPPVRAPPSPMRAQAPPVQYQVRQTTGSPSQQAPPPASNNSGGKYLYIPLLDLSRIDSNKMRRLSELGISCVVPLHENNSLSQMGIPVMNLRSEGMTTQHIPWDSVLPMGPVHQPSQQHSLPAPLISNRGVSSNNVGPSPRSQQ